MKKLTGIADKPRLEVSLPEELDPFWQEAGISAKPPQGIGVKAWLLLQMLSLIPLDFWQERLGAMPEELISAAGDTDWWLPILEGWSRSAVSMPRPEWLPGLVAWWRDFDTDDPDLTARCRQLREELLPQLLKADPDQQTTLITSLLAGIPDPALPWADMMKSLPRPWPIPLAKAWLKSLHASIRLGTREHLYAWSTTLSFAAGALPDECLSEALRQTALPEQQENEDWITTAWRRALDGFTGGVEIRRVISEEIHKLR